MLKPFFYFYYYVKLFYLNKGPYIKWVGEGDGGFYIFSKKKKNCSLGDHRPKYFMAQ